MALHIRWNTVNRYFLSAIIHFFCSPRCVRPQFICLRQLSSFDDFHHRNLSRCLCVDFYLVGALQITIHSCLNRALDVREICHYIRKLLITDFSVCLCMCFVFFFFLPLSFRSNCYVTENAITEKMLFNVFTACRSATNTAQFVRTNLHIELFGWLVSRSADSCVSARARAFVGAFFTRVLSECNFSLCEWSRTIINVPITNGSEGWFN